MNKPIKTVKHRLTNAQKIATIIGGVVEKFSDGSGSWIALENDNYTICISFDFKGSNFQQISVARKIYQVVDEKIITKFPKPKKQKL